MSSNASGLGKEDKGLKETVGLDNDTMHYVASFLKSL
jgi:hypothetical protein